MNIRLLVFGLVLSLMISSCKPEEPLSVSSISLDEYTPEHNLTIGNAIDAKVAQLYPSLSAEEAPEVMEYLNQMFDILINTSAITQRETYDWRISVLTDSTQSTAFALPNGHIYVYAGLLRFLESESQLLSLLAHEMTYIEQGEATQILDDKFGAQELGDIILDNGKADIDAIARSLPTIEIDQDRVLAADAYSVEILCPFVYEPRGIVKIINKAREDWTVAPDWFAFRAVDDIIGRINTMNRLGDACGLDGVKNESEYEAFLEDLSAF